MRWDSLDAERDLRIMASKGAQLIPRDTDGWPEQLNDLGSLRPLGLWVRGSGSLEQMGERSIAVVGARAPSSRGESMAYRLGFDLSRDGITVVSGGAYGIDSAAHDGAMRAAAGPATVAFMASGVDELYPRGNMELLTSIANHGLIVSEAPPGATAMRHRFLARNRLIAAFAQATVVVEAGYRSGAVNTAHRAAEVGKPVGAFPGRAEDDMSAGCNRLIRNGAAILVTSTNDVVELVGHLDPVAEARSAEAQATLRVTDDLSEPEVRVYSALPVTRGADITVVSQKSGLTIVEAQSAVGNLLLKGLAVKGANGWQKAR